MNQNFLFALGVLAIAVVSAVLFVNFPANPETKPQQKKAEENNITNVNGISSAVPQLDSKYQKIMNATVKTSLGDIKIELNGQNMPITAGNFAKLAEAGFYNGVKFHRVISGFMIQGGDPLTKDDSKKQMWGTGDPGYKFDDEPFEGEYSRGTIAMANSGPNTNGSQFFIMHQDYPLPPQYVIFGKVVEGLDVVDKIAELPVDSRDCPAVPPVIESIVIEK